MRVAERDHLGPQRVICESAMFWNFLPPLHSSPSISKKTMIRSHGTGGPILCKGRSRPWTVG